MAEDNKEVFLPEVDTEKKDERALNALLQQKKNKVRLALASMGFLKKGGYNSYDEYNYFSESQYKKLFNELFSANRLEMTSSVSDVGAFEGSSGMKFGRSVKMIVRLQDIDTGFFEDTQTAGEGMDKGDKALSKAMTSAIKNYYACVFTVPTGEESENDNRPVEFISEEDYKVIKQAYDRAGKLGELLHSYEINDLHEMSKEDAQDLMTKLKQKSEASKQKKNEENKS